MTAPSDETMRRYVLGELTDEARAAFEDTVFADDAAFTALTAVEADLLDAYAAGALSDNHRKALEAGVLATRGGRERLAFAEALQAKADAAPAPQRARPGGLLRWWRQALGVAAAAAAAVVLVIFATGGNPPVKLALDPVLLRDGGAKPLALVLPTDGDVVLQLRLEKGEQSQGLTVIVAGAGKRREFSGLAASSDGVVEVRLEAAELAVGAWLATLATAGGEPLAYYPFRVVGKK